MAKHSFASHGFPMIYSLDSSGTSAEGYISVKNEDIFVRLRIVDGGVSKKVNVQGDWKMFSLLKPEADVLEQHLSLCNTMVDMLREVKSFLERKKSNRLEATVKFSAAYYQIFLKQVQELGNERIYYVDPDFETIKVKARDESNREHILRMNIPASFPEGGPSFSADLPEEFTFTWSPVNTLLDVYNHFENTLTKYYNFWRQMKEIDESTWVLGPEKISPATFKRRIAIAPMASLLIIVSPTCPFGVPTCQYMGPEEVVQPLQETFSRNIDLWNEELSLLTNLKKIFGITFPSPSTSDKEDFCVDCGICFSYKLKDNIPEVICSNSKCHQPFHHVCLYEWLKMSKSTIQTSNRLGGDCPCCSEMIWCALPELEGECSTTYASPMN